ncbi:DUF3307 domain-containing protein [Christiangramia sabulilitoris]|uniref:DUF3307 domain-containing protein n=1 Tax=Christiangramia sabulilitoris TaxID=2583991 RepID=A0A550I6F0_9FLAO|nr:DUF3307 domain-containing protein [Christiangramia sabulilitoris]TRO66552.1 DUF3307 domain-containing protein [Christiangramia sabulilitoris]
MDNSVLILLQLVLAHIIADFVIQPTKWVRAKRKYKARSKYLYLHAFLSGLLTFVFLMRLDWWYIAVFIAITHFFIDLWKLQFKQDNLKLFISDQAMHLLMIFLAWLYLTSNFYHVLPFLKTTMSSSAILAVITGYLLIIFPAGFLIGKATKRWQNEVENDLQKNSLDAAGRYIGIFERILVLTFILTLNFSAIGFLIAAKSILRFSDKSETGARKQTEYVLIGTLMSFTITIAIGLLVNHIAF